MPKMPRTQWNTSLSAVAAAAFVGGLAGAVIGLRFESKIGKALRQRIQEKADSFIEHVVEDVTFHTAEAIKQEGTDLIDKGKELAKDLQTFIQASQGM